MRLLKTCTNGHQYYRSTDKPTCPVCAIKNQSKRDVLPELVAPARRALIKQGIVSLSKLSRYSEIEILALHGIGPSSMPKLKLALKESGLAFKK
jgi:hypothetical protein